MMENYMNANSNKNSNFGIPYSGKFGMWRNKRDAGDGIKDIELGDRLVAKINSYKESMVAEIGNMTCVLKEVGMLNVENQIDTQRMKQKLAEHGLPSEWFKNRFEELIDNCYEIATNLPANFMEENVVSGEFGEVNVGQVKYFLKCYGGHHEQDRGELWTSGGHDGADRLDRVSAPQRISIYDHPRIKCILLKSQFKI